MNSTRIGVRLLPVAAITVLLSACTAVPNVQLEAARSSIQNAQRAGADQHAPELFQTATERLSRAEKLMQKRRYERATRLLEMAEAEARLAEAASEASKTEASIAFIQSSGSHAQPSVTTSQIDE